MCFLTNKVCLSAQLRATYKKRSATCGTEVLLSSRSATAKTDFCILPTMGTIIHIMLTLVSNNKRKRACSDLEEAIIRDNTAVLSKLLSNAVRVPLHCLELATSHGSISTFERLLPFVADCEQQSLFNSTSLTAVAIKNGHFAMFMHLVKQHKCSFALTDLFNALNNQVVAAAEFLLNELFAFTTDKPGEWYSPISCTDTNTGKQIIILQEHNTVLGEYTFENVYVKKYLGEMRCIYSHVFKYTTVPLALSDAKHFARMRDCMYMGLCHNLNTISVDVLKVLLENPNPPSGFDMCRLLLWRAVMDKRPYILSTDILKYVHTKFNLVELYASNNEENDDIFIFALREKKFDVCDYLLELGWEATQDSWTVAISTMNFQAIQYLERIQLPFQVSSEQNSFYTTAAIYYVITGDKKVFDFLLRVKCPFNPAFKHIPIPDVMNCLQLWYYEYSRQPIVDCNSDFIVDVWSPLNEGTLHVVGSKEEINGRMIEIIEELMKLGCDWSGFKLSTFNPKYPGAVSVYFHFNSTASVDSFLSYILNCSAADNHFFLDVLMHTLSRFTYCITGEMMVQSLKVVDCWLKSETHKQKLQYLFEDVQLRKFLIEMFYPVQTACTHISFAKCYHCSSHYSNVQPSYDFKTVCPGLYTAFDTVCIDAIKAVNEIHSINSECHLGLHEDVIDNVIAACL